MSTVLINEYTREEANRVLLQSHLENLLVKFWLFSEVKKDSFMLSINLESSVEWEFFLKDGLGQRFQELFISYKLNYCYHV